MEGTSNRNEYFRNVGFPDRRGDADVWEVTAVQRESTMANGRETVAEGREMEISNTGCDRQTEGKL